MWSYSLLLIRQMNLHIASWHIGSLIYAIFSCFPLCAAIIWCACYRIILAIVSRLNNLWKFYHTYNVRDSCSNEQTHLTSCMITANTPKRRKIVMFAMYIHKKVYSNFSYKLTVLYCWIFWMSEYFLGTQSVAFNSVSLDQRLTCCCFQSAEHNLRIRYIAKYGWKQTRWAVQHPKNSINFTKFFRVNAHLWNRTFHVRLPT